MDALLEQLNCFGVGAQELNTLFKEVCLKSHVETQASKFDPLPKKDIVIKDQLEDEQVNEWKKIGFQKIYEGKAAILMLAGGMGTRLGHTGPKGTLVIGTPSKQSIFEMLTGTFMRIQEYAKESL